MILIYIYLFLCAAYAAAYLVFCARSGRSVWGAAALALLPVGMVAVLMLTR